MSERVVAVVPAFNEAGAIRRVVDEIHAVDSAIDVVVVPHMKIGMRLMDMPGARSLNTVTRKLIAPAVVEIVRNTSARA